MDCLFLLAFILPAHHLGITKMVSTKVSKLLGSPVPLEVEES